MKKVLSILGLALLISSQSFPAFASEKEKTRTLVDHTGATIELPENIDRVVISSLLPLPSVYAFYKGNTEGLIGMHPSSMAAAKNSFLPVAYPNILNINTNFVDNGGEINIEELMKLKPDLVFYSALQTKEREKYDNAGIKSVGFSTNISQYNTIETYASWIKLLGEIYGETGRADEIIQYGREIEANVNSKISTLNESEKPRVLILYKYDNGKITTSGADFFGDYWINACGGINVAKNLKGMAEINMEQIYEWNPDLIFITNFTDVLPEDLYTNAIQGHNWLPLKAVQEKKVHKFPLGMYRWFPPSSDTPLALMWLAKIIQPQLFEDIDMDKEITDYYAKFYNIALTNQDLETIYNPSRKAAGL